MSETKWTKVNANLIAAAPELYEALERFVEAAKREKFADCDCEVCGQISPANKILAKARGEK